MDGAKNGFETGGADHATQHQICVDSCDVFECGWTGQQFCLDAGGAKLARRRFVGDGDVLWVEFCDLREKLGRIGVRGERDGADA